MILYFAPSNKKQLKIRKVTDDVVNDLYHIFSHLLISQFDKTFIRYQ